MPVPGAPGSPPPALRCTGRERGLIGIHHQPSPGGPISPERRRLLDAARLYGVMPAFHDIEGRRREATTEAMISVLRSLGAPVEGPADLADAVRFRRLSLWERLLPPCLTVRAGLPVVAGLMYRDSVEIDEQKYPIIYKGVRLLADTGGAGRFRGAPGARGTAFVAGDSLAASRRYLVNHTLGRALAWR